MIIHFYKRHIQNKNIISLIWNLSEFGGGRVFGNFQRYADPDICYVKKIFQILVLRIS